MRGAVRLVLDQAVTHRAGTLTRTAVPGEAEQLLIREVRSQPSTTRQVLRNMSCTSWAEGSRRDCRVVQLETVGLDYPDALLGPEARLSVGLRVARRMLTYNTHRGVTIRATNDRKKVAPKRPSSHDAQASHTGRARDL